MTLRSLRRLFVRRLAAVRALYPGLHATLHIGDAARFPQPRNFAYCEGDYQKPARITFAPKILLPTSTVRRADGLIRHELANALALYLGVDHGERECDQIAEKLFGGRISYDHMDVQTTGPGNHPRPAWLPK